MAKQLSPQEQEWTRLISALLDESISEQEFEQLQESLRTSRDARLLYRRAVDLDFAVEEEADMGAFDSITVAPPPRRFPRPLLAATLLAAAAALMLALWPRSKVPPPTLLEQTQAKWEQDAPVPNKAFPAMDQYSTLTEGSVVIELAPNVIASIQAPATFRVDHAFLEIDNGRATIVTHNASVRVRVPGAQIINFGTEFAVKVAKGQTQAYVFDGMIEASLRDGSSPVRASRGQALSVDGYQQLIQRERYDAVDFRFSEIPGLQPEPPDYRSMVAEDGASHHWHFDNDDSADFAKPAGTSITPLTNGNRVLTIKRTEPADYQPNFEGPLPLLGGDATTIEFWAKQATEYRSHGSILSITDPKAGIGKRHLFLVESNFKDPDGELRAIYRWKPAAQIQELKVPARFDIGRWHHVVVVREADQLSLFLDGERTGQREVPPPQLDAGRPLMVHVGHLGDRMENQRWFAGQIDEIAIYPRALTDRQIRRHFELGAKLFE